MLGLSYHVCILAASSGTDIVAIPLTVDTIPANITLTTRLLPYSSTSAVYNTLSHAIISFSAPDAISFQ
jgi:hypothetical protein